MTVGALLFLAALAKATQPADTLQSLEWALGTGVGLFGLIGLIAIEIILGSFLLSTVAPRYALGAATVLFLVFVVWIGVLEWIDAPIGCGCGVRFGWSRPLLGADDRTVSLFRALGIMMACLFGCVGLCLLPASEAEPNQEKAEILL